LRKGVPLAPLKTDSHTGSRYGVALALLLAVEPIRLASPLAAFWTTPCILLASILIAWGAESAQFFVAQGFALAMLAWLQTLPEFAVEAVLAWHQQRDLLLANLTGALRLLVGLAWPIIYATAAFFYRKRARKPLRQIVLHPHHSIEVVSLILPLVYALFIWWKGSLGIYDSIVLIAIYAAYLLLLTKLPPQEQESIDDLERIPRAIVTASRKNRILAIGGCFVAGGLLIYFTAEPFLASLMGFASVIGIPIFIVVQWLAPVVSEFPELASTFYFARQDAKAPMALMNIVSSNINQWTLLVAMLPIVLSLGAGSVSVIRFDNEQEAELLLTVAQSMVGLMMLLNMQLAWWEAGLLFFLYTCQVAFANTAAQTPLFAYLAHHVRLWITEAYFAWVAIAAVLMIFRWRRPVAVGNFVATVREHF
jgi:cation:H+ antiporter